MRLVLVLALSLTLLTIPLAQSGPGRAAGQYVGAGAIVAAGGGAGAGGTFVDNGAVVCTGSFSAGTARGAGGICLPFGELGGDSVLVVDDVVGTAVTFQVCVDANGDGICGGVRFLPSVPQCPDVILFSHSSFDGANHNPLYVDPVGMMDYWSSCGAQGFPGYVVITCAGVHAGSVEGPHAHGARSGAVLPAFTGGTPSGDFCGGATAAKAYTVQ